MLKIGKNMSIAGRAMLAGGVMGMGVMPGVAQAALYNWTFVGSDPVFVSTGQFNETGGLIDSFSGSWRGVAISGLSPVNTVGGNDNLYPLNFDGVAFELVAPLPGGDIIVNLYADGFVAPFIWFGKNSSDGGYGTFSASPVTAEVPEPASAVLLGAAVAGLMAAARRRRVKDAATA